MSCCCVKWCGKNSRTSNYTKDGITFHRFPRNGKIKSMWIDATKRNDDWFPAKTSVICSRHFTIDCFLTLKKNRRRLLEGAIPTMCLPRLIDDVEPDLHLLKNNDDPGIKKELSVASASEDVMTKQADTLTDQLDSIQNMQQDGNSSENPALATLTTATELSQPTVPNSKKRSFKTAFKYPSPSLYDTPDKKRLCRQINEMAARLKVKNKKLKYLRDMNRHLKKRVSSLCTVLGELKKQLLITPENK